MEIQMPDVANVLPVTNALLIQVYKGKVDNAAGIASTTQYDYAKIGVVVKAGPAENTESFQVGDKVLFRRNLSDPHFLMRDGEVIDCFFISAFDVVAKIVDQSVK